MPEGKDPDDYIKEYGKTGLLGLLKKKEIIQSYIWNYQLDKINKNNPYEISKFEKEIKKLAYSIQDETLKKYVLEDFLEKIKMLTPIQTLRPNNNYFWSKNKRNYKILKETKILHQKRKDLSKTQILESSILFIILNYTKIASKKLEELSDIEFVSQKNELLKKKIINLLSEGNSKTELQLKVKGEHETTINEILDNSNIKLITKNKNDQEILDLIDDFILDFKEQNNLRKIESLEKKLINNLDENSYSELVKLKNQLNRD